jgi:hypothetical protein
MGVLIVALVAATTVASWSVGRASAAVFQYQPRYRGAQCRLEMLNPAVSSQVSGSDGLSHRSSGSSRLGVRVHTTSRRWLGGLGRSGVIRHTDTSSKRSSTSISSISESQEPHVRSTSIIDLGEYQPFYALPRCPVPLDSVAGYLQAWAVQYDELGDAIEAMVRD